MPVYEGVKTPFTCALCGATVQRLELAAEPPHSRTAHTPEEWEAFWAATDPGKPDTQKRRMYLEDVQIPSEEKLRTDK